LMVNRSAMPAGSRKPFGLFLIFSDIFFTDIREGTVNDRSG